MTTFILRTKNILAGWWIAPFLFLLTACEGFLDRDPLDQVSREQALADVFSVRLAVNGAYSRLTAQDYYRVLAMLYYPEAAGGNLKPNPEGLAVDLENLEPFYDFRVEPLGEIEDVYSAPYQVIGQVNDIIEAIPALPDGTEQEKDHLLGEALALRALAHFDLVRLFAQPYNFTPDASHPGVVVAARPVGIEEALPRSSVRDVYARVAADFERALVLLEGYAGRSPNTVSWLTARAVRGLLARVYLYQGNYGRAVTLATQAIGGEALADSAAYVAGWQSQGTHPETIFQVDMTGLDDGFSEICGAEFPRPAASVTDDLLALYDSADIRRQLFVTNADGLVLTRKFPFVNERVNNVPVVRLSEMYLIRAEAFAALGREAQAREDLNRLRLRANPAAASFTEGGEALRDEIFRERRRELALEGHALFDLTRQGRDLVRADCDDARYRCDRAYPNDRFVLPIPETELFFNPNLTPNPGY